MDERFIWLHSSILRYNVLADRRASSIQKMQYRKSRYRVFRPIVILSELAL